MDRPTKTVKLLAIILSVILFNCIDIKAQSDDFCIWKNIEFSKKINKRFDLKASLGNRLCENATQRDESLVDVGVDYGKKWFSTGLKYRFINEFDRETSNNIGHEFTYQFELKTSYKRFDIDMRNRLQAEYMNFYSSRYGKTPEIYYRNRVRLKYNIKGLPLNPYTYLELFYKINEYPLTEIEKNRIAIGMDYKINKNNSISVRYICQFEILASRAEQKHILGLEYSIDL